MPFPPQRAWTQSRAPCPWPAGISRLTQARRALLRPACRLRAVAVWNLWQGKALRCILPTGPTGPTGPAWPLARGQLQRLRPQQGRPVHELGWQSGPEWACPERRGVRGTSACPSAGWGSAGNPPGTFTVIPPQGILMLENLYVLRQVKVTPEPGSSGVRTWMRRPHPTNARLRRRHSGGRVGQHPCSGKGTEACGAGATLRETADGDSENNDFSARSGFANAYKSPGRPAFWLCGHSLLTAGFRGAARVQLCTPRGRPKGTSLSFPVLPSPVCSRSPLSRSSDNRRCFASFSLELRVVFRAWTHGQTFSGGLF